MIKPRNTLGADERLKSRKLISELFSRGRSFGSYPLRISWIHLAEGFPVIQAGFTVSKKHFKRAVDRNRIKRLLRESYRLQKHSLRELLQEKGMPVAIFIMFTGKDMPSYDDIFAQMNTALKKLEKEVM